MNGRQTNEEIFLCENEVRKESITMDNWANYKVINLVYTVSASIYLRMNTLQIEKSNHVRHLFSILNGNF